MTQDLLNKFCNFTVIAAINSMTLSQGLLLIEWSNTSFHLSNLGVLRINGCYLFHWMHFQFVHCETKYIPLRKESKISLTIVKKKIYFFGLRPKLMTPLGKQKKKIAMPSVYDGHFWVSNYLPLATNDKLFYIQHT